MQALLDNRRNLPNEILLLYATLEEGELIQGILKGAGFSLRIEHYSHCFEPDKYLPQLLLLSADIPEFDLHYFIDRRNSFKSQYIPIVLFSTSIYRCASRFLDLGVDDFILNPVDCQVEFISRIRARERVTRVCGNECFHERLKMFLPIFHDLRNSILAVTHVTTCLNAGFYGNSLDDFSNILSTLIANHNNIYELVDDLNGNIYRQTDLSNTIFQSVDLLDFISSIVSELKPYSLTKNLDLNFVFAEHFPLKTEIYGNPLLLWRMFFNLISNAIKFTNSGVVQVSLVPIGTDLVVEVADSGIGIAATSLEHIFKRFYREHDTLPGEGLGLYTVKSVVDLHQGNIKVSSTPGEGSIFSVTLPIDNTKNEVNGDNLEYVESMVLVNERIS